MADMPALIRSERLDLIDFLETLAPEDWATPSLCEAWSVQDVAAHLAWSSELRPGEAVSRLVRSGFSINRMTADSAREWSTRGTAAILDQLRENADRGLRPTGTSQTMTLTDAVCHALDIRRPLGRTRPLDATAFPTVAGFFAGLRWPLNTSVGGHFRRTFRGLRLVADDLDWTYGSGPEVEGSAESLLMVLSGRRVQPDELTGPGAATLYARL
ncbi:MAG: maleylpyruvate isomerase family mycothiol-dependent enzyme [Nocardioides sp.]